MYNNLIIFLFPFLLFNSSCGEKKSRKQEQQLIKALIVEYSAIFGRKDFTDFQIIVNCILARTMPISRLLFF